MIWTQLQHLQLSFEPRTCDCSLKPAMFPSASALGKRMEKGWLGNSSVEIIWNYCHLSTQVYWGYQVPFKSIAHQKACSCDWKLVKVMHWQPSRLMQGDMLKLAQIEGHFKVLGLGFWVRETMGWTRTLGKRAAGKPNMCPTLVHLFFLELHCVLDVGCQLWGPWALAPVKQCHKLTKKTEAMNINEQFTLKPSETRLYIKSSSNLKGEGVRRWAWNFWGWMSGRLRFRMLANMEKSLTETVLKSWRTWN